MTDTTDVTATVLTCEVGDRTYCINYYLNYNALNGILVSLFCIFFLVVGMLQLFYVQTQSIFASSSVDFGKIEK